MPGRVLDLYRKLVERSDMNNYSIIHEESSNNEFVKIPPEVRFPIKRLEKVCSLLFQITQFLESWSPESYPGYFIACALALVSIISAGRVKFVLRGCKSTNFYIVLVGSTGLSVKTEVMNIVREILYELNLKFLLFPDRVTAQKFFYELCIHVPENFEKESDLVKKNITDRMQRTQAFKGQRGWIYDELGGLFREMMQSTHTNAAYRDLLRMLYDNRPDLKNDTVGRGDEIAHYPFLTLLGGMTPADLSPYAKVGSAAWRDGLFARIAFICPPDDFLKNEQFPDGEMKIPDSIITWLNDWHYRLGEPTIRLTPEVVLIPAKGQVYDLPPDVRKAFYEYRKALKTIILNSTDPDLAGNYIRYPEMALKIATLIASLNNENEISLDAWGFGQNLTEEWRFNLHRLYYSSLPRKQSKDNSSIMEPLDRVLKIILVRGPLTARDIQQQTGFQTDFVGLLISTLLENRKIVAIPEGRTVLYRAKV